MGRLARQFTDDDLRAIGLAIGDAERRSGCEIIPVISFDSGRYDRGEDVFGVICGLILVAVFWVGYTFVGGGTAEATGLWRDDIAAPLGLVSILGLMAGGFIGGAFLATKIPSFKTLFVSRQEMQEEVARAAQACFYNQGIRKASHEAGVLIYVSQYERMVQIIGDDAAAAKINEDDWQSICQLLLDGMRQNNPTFGLVSAINRTGLLLDGAFTKQEGQGVNFADALIILE